MHRSSLVVSLCLSSLACAGAPASPKTPDRSTAVPAASVPTPELTGDVHDFDFLGGAWTGKNRRLKARGVGSNDWEEFPGAGRAVSHLGGVTQIEDVEFPTKAWSGLTIRVFNLEKRQWSIYWISSKVGEVLPPVVGGFKGDRGEFYGDDEDDGHPVKVRFVWTKLAGGRARWEQAFSTDGHSWETNWVNDVELARPAP